jgi:putative oxidoreductase
MLETSDLGLLILRLFVGLTLAAHGAQKLVTWWGGPGLAGWTHEIDGMGLRPASFWAISSMLAMLGGGLLVAAGLLTPLGAAALVGPLVVIIFRSKRGKGFWNLKGGAEYPIMLLAAVTTIALTGPGALSLDRLLGLTVPDMLRFVLVLLAITGGLAAVVFPRPAAATESASRGI